MTFAEELEAFIGNEQVDGVELLTDRKRNDLDPTSILTWEEARPILDYEYYCGYGSRDCHSLYIWTPTRVIFIHEYDGATWPEAVPRNP